MPPKDFSAPLALSATRRASTSKPAASAHSSRNNSLTTSSMTARAKNTCMSSGAFGTSIVRDSRLCRRRSKPASPCAREITSVARSRRNSCAAISRSRAPRSSAASTALFTTVVQSAAALMEDGNGARGDALEMDVEVAAAFPNRDKQDKPLSCCPLS